MENLNHTQIRTIGNFLANYYSDLLFIKKFNYYINNETQSLYFSKEEVGSFENFLSVYRVARNRKGGQTTQLFNVVKQWIWEKKYTDYNDVDVLAEKLGEEGITIKNSKNMISLSSKILFLYNPCEIIPYDGNAKLTMGYNDDKLKSNRYNLYMIKLFDWKKARENIIIRILEFLKPYTSIIEGAEEFRKISNINIIRKNRFIDMMLWSGWEDNI